MCSAVVSSRISKRDKETLKQAGIDLSEETRKHLQEVAAKIRIRKSIERLSRTIEQQMPSARRGYSKRSVREDREGN